MLATPFAASATRPALRATLAILMLCLLPILPLSAAPNTDPAAWWGFDNITKTNNQILDSAANLRDTVNGHFFPAPGVVGQALKFDGYTTEIVRPATHAPTSKGAFTLETWLALGAYPWNWCPIIMQADGTNAGYAFSIGPRGQLRLQAAAGRQWRECVSEDFAIPLRKWTHVAGVFDPDHGLALYVNGQPAGQMPASGAFTPAADADLRIGAVPAPEKPSNIHREFGTLPGWFSLDGVLDELKLFRRALNAAEVQKHFTALRAAIPPDLPLRKMPAGPPGPGRFGAYYCRLKFYDGWDALWRVGPDPDVVVRFDETGARVVFWRGTRYSAAWVSENDRWMADQSVEAWNKTEGCYEHMQDPKCLYAHVRIIENTDARVVVHWRYAPVSSRNHLWRVDPKTGFACWVDEYYTIYPDAAGVRKVTWQNGSLGGPRQFQESLPFTQPGQLSGDVVEKDFCTVANLRGQSAVLSFVEKPEKKKPGVPADLTIQVYHFKAQNDPFIIYEPGNKMHYVADRNIRGLSRPGACNHWPVGQMPCDGRTSQAPDRPTHFLGFPISYPPLHTNDTRVWWNGLYGMTTRPLPDLVRLARSWNQPPPLALTGPGFRSDGFDRGERAYQVTRVSGENSAVLKATLQASEESPLFNVPLVVHHWGPAGAKLKLNGRPVPRGKQFRFGHRHRLEESSLLVWIKLESTRPVTIELAPVEP